MVEKCLSRLGELVTALEDMNECGTMQSQVRDVWENNLTEIMRNY